MCKPSIFILVNLVLASLGLATDSNVSRDPAAIDTLVLQVRLGDRMSSFHLQRFGKEGMLTYTDSYRPIKKIPISESTVKIFFSKGNSLAPSSDDVNKCQRSYIRITIALKGSTSSSLKCLSKVAEGDPTRFLLTEMETFVRGPEEN